MELKNKIIALSKAVKALDRQNPDNKLPQNAYYLNDREIVCFEREKGFSRFPYDSDGLVVWAKSTGHIEASESTFNIFNNIVRNEDPYLDFFIGLPIKNDEFFPISVLGATRQLFEPISVLRYIVYSLSAAYYIAETDNFISAVRVNTDKDKHIHFAFITVNKGDKNLKLYASSYFEPWLNYTPLEWYSRLRYGKRIENSYLFSREGNYLTCNYKIQGAKIDKEYYTCGRTRFFGVGGTQLLNATSLKTGKISEQVSGVNTTDVPVLANIYHLELQKDEYLRIDYDMSYCHDKITAEGDLGKEFDTKTIDDDLKVQEENEVFKLSKMNIKFDDWQQGVNVNVLNKFLKNVQKQVKLCALGKNYAGSLIGIRDVMQQLETSLIWQPEESREKIITALSYTLEDGRPPRQFSVPAKEGDVPQMDLREYIDQGNWIVSTLYTYLCYTNDYSILSEICGYYKVIDNDKNVAVKSREQDTVLEHIIKIMDFLTANIDKEETNCLKILIGDWNDALNGLGLTTDKDKKFGTGVSVMASAHYYQNCKEINEILAHVGGYQEKIDEYNGYRERIKEGLLKHAVDENSQHKKRVVHGWGDKLAYKIGGWNDPDGFARTSSTANSFWALSGMIDNVPEMKGDLTDAFRRLMSKYGLLTFDKPFSPSMNKYVGKIADMTHGTYENYNVYVHASTFAMMALFVLGESEWAWEELEKSIVISHENCTMTSFVMPNSYCYNEEYSIDGDSRGDWYTGSGTVLIKGIIKYGFGICPDLDGVAIQTAKTLPTKSASIEILLKGKKATLEYKNKSIGKRQILIDGKPADLRYDKLMDTYKAYIPTSEIHDGILIEVID